MLTTEQVVPSAFSELQINQEVSQADKVLDVVKAVENLAMGTGDMTGSPKSPGVNNAELKKTTIVMSKHTLASPSLNVSIPFLISFNYRCHYLCLKCLYAYGLDFNLTFNGVKKANIRIFEVEKDMNVFVIILIMIF